jgi:osmotically-inducible protein OsmY
MTIANLDATDLRVRDAVMAQLEWDSQVDAEAIGVAARDSVVTLTGFTTTYASKLAAERAAKRVRGVRAVANDIQVRLRLDRTDVDIAADAVKALTLHALVPESVQVVVHDGHVTLTGTVATLFHRAIAERAVHYVRGVKSMANRIAVVPAATPIDVRREIARAFHRDATVDSRGITVTVNDNRVILTGKVRTWQERESAERAATHARGITEIDNRITVAWPYDEGPLPD